MEQPARDDKDWTWVLDRRCPGCGYEAATVDRDQLGMMFRANASAWRSMLARGRNVAVRPPVAAGESVVWSALEYGAHVRDVYGVFHDRAIRMLTQDEPTFPDWDQDHAAIAGAYGEQEPGHVGYELAVKAGEVADVVDRLRGGQWERPGQRADGASFTVESLMRYVLHDVTHHLNDAEAGFEAIAEAEAAEAEDEDSVDGEIGEGEGGGEAERAGEAGAEPAPGSTTNGAEPGER